MKRRTFIKISTISPIIFSGCLNKTNYFWTTISNIQNIILPKSTYGPSASEIGATVYLQNVSIHSSFDTRDLQLLKIGVKYLHNKHFNFLPQYRKDKILKTFIQTSLGQRWINLLVYYTLESLFCDPIYGGNTSQIGWKWINHSVGYPRPVNTFGDII